MEDKKYEILEDDFIIHEGRKLYRIKALKTVGMFSDVSKGDIGGYVEGYHNLSNEGNCWIFHDAKVYENARVKDNAIIGGSAEIFGNAVVKDYSAVGDNARVFGNASICGFSRVISNTVVFGNAVVTGNSDIFGNSNSIYGNALLKGKASIIRSQSVCHVSDNVLIESVIKINSQKSLVELSGNSVFQEFTEIEDIEE
jgi:carbonic anhydrase/acetyltransferase-like protein (isoleucine patch superfamily)